MSSPASDGDLAALRRWEHAGGLWRVVSREAGFVDIALLTCSADEEMGRLHTDDPAVLALVRDQPLPTAE
jgi:hypothetical protein